MSHTIWHDDLLLGTVDLPRGQFVAGRLRPAVDYSSVADAVQRSTVAFLYLGLFYGHLTGHPLQPDAGQWFEAIEQASGLRFTLTDADGQPLATHFVNLLDSPVSSGVVVLVSLENPIQGRPASIYPSTTPPISSGAPAV